MLDRLATIKHLIDEHQTTREHLKLVGDSLTDQEAIRALEKTRSDWIPGRLGDLPEKRKRLQQTLSLLEEGLRNHFTFEERVLPPLVGELLAEALVLEHRELTKEIGRARSMVAIIRLEGLSREELLPKEAQVQEMIDNILQKKGEHLTKEEAILDMVQRALEERARQSPIEELPVK